VAEADALAAERRKEKHSRHVGMDQKTAAVGQCHGKGRRGRQLARDPATGVLVQRDSLVRRRQREAKRLADRKPTAGRGWQYDDHRLGKRKDAIGAYDLRGLVGHLPRVQCA
jgi:hypothetical protein